MTINFSRQSLLCIVRQVKMHETLITNNRTFASARCMFQASFWRFPGFACLAV